MYYFAANDLLNRMKLISDGLLLQIKFVEFYNDQVFDLVNARKPCELREDEFGNLRFRAPTEKLEDGKIVVRSLASSTATSIEEIVAIMRQGLKHRKAGISTLHEQSSRSHALFEMEIVNEELLDIRERIIHAESEVCSYISYDTTDHGAQFFHIVQSGYIYIYTIGTQMGVVS